jgi:hypothetical protein
VPPVDDATSKDITMSMKNIENLARDLSDARGSLNERVRTYQDELERVKRRLLPGIKRAAEAAAQARDRLQAEIERDPRLFGKPKSVIFHGIRVGYQKAKGTIAWEDGDKVVALIRKHFSEQVDVLVKVEERPVKSALAQLSVADLKRLGVTVIETGDEVLIKPVDGEVEKLVDALLKEQSAEFEEAEA